MRKLIILILLAFLMSGCRQEQKVPVALENISTYRLLSEHNQHRNSQLVIDFGLEDYAQEHAEWMVKTRRFTHSSLNVSGWSRLGENIAWGQRDEATVTREWMNSPGHRANIMNEKYTHVGFGFAKSEGGEIYWCAVFGG